MPTAKKKTVEKKGAAKVVEPTYVTEARFEVVEQGMLTILDKLDKLANPVMTAASVPVTAATVPSIPETAEEIAIRNAKANPMAVNPDWEAMAREIIGEPLDHCEFAHVKNGGMHFTIVIKNEFSNAGKDYLERYKQDRRTKEISAEGVEGVEAWCRLVKANLGRPTPIGIH